MDIKRTSKINELEETLEYSPAAAILGPRQCGKTTLAHQFAQEFEGEVHFFDLENPADLVLLDNPKLSLEPLEGLIIIDEIQRAPDIFPVLRVLIDKYKNKKFLILGSASRDLLAQSSESLAGRICYHELSGFTLDEIKESDLSKRWNRGGFPRSFLANSDNSSFKWRQDFVSTFLERDIPTLGINIPAKTMRRFWQMLSHFHGKIFNASEIARSINVSNVTAQRYLDVLSGTFLIRQLQPWYYNTKKRLVKSPKIFFRDAGLFHVLLDLKNGEALRKSPYLGASWEGFCLEQVIRCLNLKEEDCYFWAVHTGAECDLVFQKNGALYGVEVKYQDAPKVTRSMHRAIKELSLKHLWVIYPGDRPYKLEDNISVVPLSNLALIRDGF